MKPVNSTRFEFKRVKSVAGLRFYADVRCACCEANVRVHWGAVCATFRIGNQTLGVVCEACLTPDTHARLEELRQRFPEESAK